MMTTLYVARNSRRRTHIISRDGHSLCGHSVKYTIANLSSDIQQIDMCGGASTRVVHDFRVLFNDDTCCMRCTRILRMLMLCHVTRDTGTR